LLVAFLVSIIVGGGGGVTAPWLPAASRDRGPAITVAQARLASGFVTWRMHRME